MLYKPRNKKRSILFNAQCQTVFASHSLGRSNLQLLNVETENKGNNFVGTSKF